MDINITNIFSDPMNETDHFEDLKDIGKGIPLYFLWFCYLSIFPFFLAVFHLNKEKEKETAVYHIIYYFVVTVKRMYALQLFQLTIFPAIAYFETYWIQVVILIMYLTTGWILTLTNRVNQSFMGILAIQRFTLYFYPSSEKYVKITPTTLQWIISIEYLYFLIEPLLLMYFAHISNLKHLEYRISLNKLYFFFGEHIFLILSNSLYIPIIISIRKLTHLTSAQQNKPQNFIICQCLLIVVEKIIFAICIFFKLSSEYHTMKAISTTIDTYVSIFVIQLSYILCNKRNMSSFFKLFKSDVTCLKFYCPCCRIFKSSRTQPEATAVQMQIYSTQAN